LRADADLFGQKLKSGEAMKARVFCFIDHAHPSATELFENAVTRDGLPE
jgi:hypothetical protein